LIQTGDGVSKSLSAVLDWSHSVMSIRDRNMLQFMNIITDKPEWTRKVYNEKIVGKWKAEAKKSSE